MSKPLPTDSILIYQHNTTRNYVAVLNSVDLFTAPPGTDIPATYSSPALAVKYVRSGLYAVLTPNWLLVDTLTSDIYPELFL